MIWDHPVDLPDSTQNHDLLPSQTMVFYYQSTAVDPPATIYIGKDKFESDTPPLCHHACTIANEGNLQTKNSSSMAGKRTFGDTALYHENREHCC